MDLQILFPKTTEMIEFEFGSVRVATNCILFDSIHCNWPTSSTNKSSICPINSIYQRTLFEKSLINSNKFIHSMFQCLFLLFISFIYIYIVQMHFTHVILHFFFFLYIDTQQLTRLVTFVNIVVHFVFFKSGLNFYI